jgi:hypothetical protein
MSCSGPAGTAPPCSTAAARSSLRLSPALSPTPGPTSAEPSCQRLSSPPPSPGLRTVFPAADFFCGGAAGSLFPAPRAVPRWAGRCDAPARTRQPLARCRAAPPDAGPPPRQLRISAPLGAALPCSGAPHLTGHSADVIGDATDLHVLGATTVEPPFGLFDWYLKPHLYSPDFPERDDAWADYIAARADFPIYFIRDSMPST